MARSRQARQPRGAAATTTQALPSFDDDSVDDENPDEDSNTVSVAQNNEDIPVDTSETTQLKANVWQYAKKVTTEIAQCLKCKIYVKTVRGGTTTLRKHLITKHNLIHLTLHTSPRVKMNNLISQEQKRRLDYLANVAVFEDGRTFGDLRKQGIRKFLAEAVPGYIPPHRNQVQLQLKRLVRILRHGKPPHRDNEDSEDDDDDEENRDLIMDAWGNGVITGDTENMDVDNNDDDDDITITKEKVAKAVQKGRSLIKTIRRSQILTGFINDEKPTFDVTCRLTIDCINRWNSTYLALYALLEHKPILANLFENKRKLPITSKQKEKLGLLELSSDDWAIFKNLMDILDCFYNATVLLSGSKYPTIGLCLFAVRSIKDYMENNDKNQSNIYQSLKEFILESLDHYFDEENEQFSLLMLYGYFDPYGYAVLTPKERSKVERQLKQKNKDQNKSQTTTTTSSMSTSSSSSSSSSIPVPRTSSANSNPRINMKYIKEKSSRLDLFLKSVDKINIVTEKFTPKTISEEIALYASICKKNSPIEADAFWQLHGHQMPMLKAMAQEYLSTPGTSVPSESAFSCSAYVGRKERARLSPENLSYTVFLKDKLRSS